MPRPAPCPCLLMLAALLVACQGDPTPSIASSPAAAKQPSDPPAGCPPLGAAGGVIDEDGPCFEAHGPTEYWRLVIGEGHGGRLLWTNAFEAEAPSNWARWQVSLDQAGRYRVELHSVPTYATFAKTRYALRHGGQETAVVVDQSQAAAGWYEIATLDFDAGADQWVAVYDSYDFAVAEDQHIVVDAIRLTPVAPPAPADAGPPDAQPDAAQGPVWQDDDVANNWPPDPPPDAATIDAAHPASDPRPTAATQPAPTAEQQGGCRLVRGVETTWLTAPILVLAVAVARRRRRARR